VAVSLVVMDKGGGGGGYGWNPWNID